MISALKRSQIPPSPSDYASSDLEAFPLESPRTPVYGDFLDSLLELGTPRTPTATDESVTVEVIDTLPTLPPAVGNQETPVAPEPEIGKEIETPNTKNKNTGPVKKTPLLENLFQSSKEFHPVRPREPKPSIFKVGKISNRRSLAIQETLTRKNRRERRNKANKENQYHYKVCKSDIKGAVQWYKHLEGKKQKKKVKNTDIPNCEICKLSFSSPEDRTNHLNSTNHRENCTFGTHSIQK